MTIGNLVKALLVLIGLAAVVWGCFVAWRIFFHETRTHVVLAENVRLTSEWKEVGNQSMLQVKKQYHHISLRIEPPLTTSITGIDSLRSGITVPGDTVVSPEIVIMDVDGVEYPLVISGSSRSGSVEDLVYRRPDQLPLDKTYRAVRLRSDIPITIKAVLWSGYDQSDMK